MGVKVSRKRRYQQSDYDPSRRQEIFDYLFDHDKINAAHIIAFGTLKLKSAINTLGKGLDIDFKETQKITKDIDEQNKWIKNEDLWRKKYPELFIHVDRVIENKNECIVSASVHPCGVIVSSQDIESELGYYFIEDRKTKRIQPCIAIDMDSIEMTGYTKLDILAVDAYQMLADTCKLVGIDFLKMMPEELRGIENDIKIWNSIKEDTTSIFQFSKPAGAAFLPRLLSDTSIARIRKQSPDVPMVDLVSFASAAIRPAGNTFREKVADGYIIDHKHNGLNNFLKETMGALVYQEDIMKMLNQFAGQSMGASYKTLKAISKKRPEVLNTVIPELKTNLINLLIRDGVDKNTSEETSENLIKALIAATGYGFSRCHSLPYAYLAFAQGYLRYHYPIEYYTAALNAAEGKDEKIQALIQSATKQKIKIEKPVFGQSGIGYEMNKEEGIIYRGVDTIKSLKEPVAIYLKEKQNTGYKSFDDFMLDLYDPKMYAELNEIENYSVPKKKPLASNQINILIDIGFFDCFSGDLKACHEAFSKGANNNGKFDKKDSRATKEKKLNAIKEILEVEYHFSSRERLLSELKYLDSPYLVDGSMPVALFLVSNQIKEGWDISYEIYQPKTGRRFRAKIDPSLSYGLKTEMFLKISKFRNETTPNGSHLIRITEATIL